MHPITLPQRPANASRDRFPQRRNCARISATSTRLPEEPPWFEPDDEPAQCSSDNYNNDIFFVQADPGVGDTRLVLDSGSVTLSGMVGGSAVTGDGDLRGALSGCVGDACSTLALSMQSTGVARLTEFLGMSLEPADVGTSSATVTLDRFRVELWEAAVGTHTSYTNVVIPPEKAQFVVSTTSDSACYGVVGVNETQIQLRKIRNSYWSASTFTIVYHDTNGQPWDLVVMPSRWR